VPGLALVRSTLPSAPTGTITRLATVWPATKLTFEATGRAVPSGKAVMNPPC
jgi:hypothetical protein